MTPVGNSWSCREMGADIQVVTVDIQIMNVLFDVLLCETRET